MVVHLPIGILLIAAVMDWVAGRWPDRFEKIQAAVPFVLAAGALSAWVSVVFGNWLAAAGAYSPEDLNSHKWFGIGTAVIATLTWLLRNTTWYKWGLPLAALGLVITGHLGGNLTHGEDYLFQNAPAFVQRWMGMEETVASVDLSQMAPDSIVVFQDILLPVIKDKCERCHNESKSLGDLQLHTAAAFEKGGDHGPVVEAGRPRESEIFKRVTLPMSSSKFMPPDKRNIMSYDQIRLLSWWIDQGADLKQTLAAAGELPPDIALILEKEYGISTREKSAVLQLSAPPADVAAMDAAKAAGWMVQPIMSESNLLDVQLAAPGSPVSADMLQLLQPLAGNITWLRLSGSNLKTGDLAALSSFSNLTRLHLDRNPVDDNIWAHLTGLTHLEYLNLYGSQVTDAGLANAQPIQSLTKLYLWQTLVTPQGAQALRDARPDMTVDMGLVAEAEN